TVSVTATDDGGLSSLVSFSFSNFLTVIGGQIYYKGSDFDTSTGISSALDLSKTLLRPSAISKTTSFENVSNYTLGINGMVLDLNGVSITSLSASDFMFRVAPAGSGGIVTPSSWDSAPAPTLIYIQPKGPSAFRIRLEWADNAIQNTWLQIIVLSNVNTALQNPEVFYVGHALGEVDGSTPYRLSTIDIGMVRAAVGNTLVPVSDARDVDKDQRITTADVGFLRARVSNAILLDDITIPATGSPSEGAARNGMPSAAVLLNPETTPQLDSYIDDGTLRHDKAGHAYFYDTDAITQSSLGSNVASPTAVLESPQPSSPLGLTVPVYHSNPSFTKKIYLDFDGQQITGSSWNNDNYTGTYNTGNVINAPAFSTDSDLTTFSTSEQAAIQDVWARVSEDYDPYQVDVTTEPPSVSAFTAGKQAIRAMFTTDVDATSGTQWFPNAGGVAYLGSWDWKDGSPVWIFTNHLGSSKNYAEAAAHEVGHSFNLSHDGRNSPAEGYYQGHGAGATGWAPIMGVGYYRPVSQWSKGEYISANNTEDDLAIINSRLAYLVDDHGNTSASATQLVVGFGGAIANSGVITTRADVDAFRFPTQTGIVTINVDPLGVSGGKGNLDVNISLLNSMGAVVANSNGLDVLNATLTTTLSKGTYTVLVDGVGRAAITGDQGYPDYASLGQFTLSGTVLPNQPPIALADVVNFGVNQSKLLDVLANDSDPNLDVLSIQSVETPAVGTISIESGKIRFTPPNGYLGTVIFPYTIVDELGATASASVTVIVVPN
ncbi:MAG TPA: Ig-like domain-containing protein, partial [Pirellula sp.]|nr:Ig-like domain-containing protein [Pirellula sp.]